VAVFKAVGHERADQYRLLAHRLAVWGELPGIPDAALGPMLRHELEHARRWQRSGTRFFDADDLLRAAVREAGGDGYAALPSELEANAASAAYAALTVSAAELEELRASPECTSLLNAALPPVDVVEATLQVLEARRDWGRLMDDDDRREFVAEVRAACAAWDERRADMLDAGAAGPVIVAGRPV
jgi:hypothetical protein